MVVTLGQQYNIGEKPSTVILYTFINRHAGKPEKQRRQNSTSSNMVVIIYCYIGCETVPMVKSFRLSIIVNRYNSQKGVRNVNKRLQDL